MGESAASTGTTTAAHAATTGAPLMVHNVSIMIPKSAEWTSKSRKHKSALFLIYNKLVQLWDPHQILRVHYEEMKADKSSDLLAMPNLDSETEAHWKAGVTYGRLDGESKPAGFDAGRFAQGADNQFREVPHDIALNYTENWNHIHVTACESDTVFGYRRPWCLTVAEGRGLISHLMKQREAAINAMDDEAKDKKDALRKEASIHAVMLGFRRVWNLSPGTEAESSEAGTGEEETPAVEKIEYDKRTVVCIAHGVPEPKRKLTDMTSSSSSSSSSTSSSSSATTSASETAPAASGTTAPAASGSAASNGTAPATPTGDTPAPNPSPSPSPSATAARPGTTAPAGETKPEEAKPAEAPKRRKRLRFRF